MRIGVAVMCVASTIHTNLLVHDRRGHVVSAFSHGATAFNRSTGAIEQDPLLDPITLRTEVSLGELASEHGAGQPVADRYAPAALRRCSSWFMCSYRSRIRGRPPSSAASRSRPRHWRSKDEIDARLIQRGKGGRDHAAVRPTTLARKLRSRRSGWGRWRDRARCWPARR